VAIPAQCCNLRDAAVLVTRARYIGLRWGTSGIVIFRGLARSHPERLRPSSDLVPTLPRPPYLKEPPSRIVGQVFLVLSYKTYRCREFDLMFI
jgi:hypothetical protein